MKNCRWIVVLVFLLLYLLIVFRYVQKRPVIIETASSIPEEQQPITPDSVADMTTTNT